MWLVGIPVLAVLAFLAFTIFGPVSKTVVPGPESTGGVASGTEVARIPAVEDIHFPEPTNYAVDEAGVLSKAELGILNDYLKVLDTKDHQFGVALVKTTGGLPIEEYGIKLAEKWKVGGKDTNNGAIIIIATEDKKIRIEVGSGLEAKITDAEAGRVIDNYMIPALKGSKESKWNDAILAGLGGLVSAMK